MLSLKNKLCLALLSGVLVVSPVGLRHTFAKEDTELSKHMEGMEGDLKKLRKSVKDAAENTASLETIGKIQQAIVASKALTPAKAATVPEADRAKFVANYRKDMAALLEHFCKIETAVLDNDNAKAEELFKSIKKQEDDGHEKYSDQ